MVKINREHPEYRARKAMWRKYRQLYIGGEEMKLNAGEYLMRRQKEPLDVYNERLQHAFYENYVGSIIDWYASTLFRREPMMTFEGTNQAGRAFFNTFSEDCDLKGSALSDLMRRQLVDALVYGVSYVAIDFPRAAEEPRTRAEEEAQGVSRAYLVPYSAEDLVNWSTDERGNFDWVLLKTSRLSLPVLDAPDYVHETRWIYYDKEDFRIYRSVPDARGEESLVLVDAGRHGLAAQRRVPLFELRITEGLWLMNKAALLQLEHFNKSNALSWGLTMGLFATPVVYSERPWEQVVGESYYIQLAPGDRFGWTEPEGRVYQIAVENLTRLKDEIYRVCYLMSQATGSSARHIGQSGLSKQRDYAITQEVLRAYGDSVKDVLKRLLRAIEAARADGLQIDVSGLDEFDIGDFSGEIADAERLLNLGIASPTLQTQVFKKLAFKYLCDVRQEIKDRIGQEIDEAGQ